MKNSSKADSETYAVVVSNPQEVQAASVRVEDMRGPQETLRTLPGADIVLQPGDLHIFEITCKTGCPETSTHIEGSGLAPRSAFRVVSDIPVLAYQWNPYGVDMGTADASLLIPKTSLDIFYIGAAWAHGVNGPSYLTVVATEDNTEVTVTPTVTARGGNALGTIPAGTSASIVLDAFDVFQIQSSTQEEDITGTSISASLKVVVFGGNPCANVPNEEYKACDHVEEQLLPLSAWGAAAVLARYAPRMDAPGIDFDAKADPALWRIVAGRENMTVAFDPPVDGIGPSYHFSALGEVLEFESPVDHYARGELDTPIDGETEAPFLAYQIMTGADYPEESATLSLHMGDPMMLLTPPAGQYLDRYVFNTDNRFDFAFDRIIVVRPLGAVVELDCLGVLDDEKFTEVGNCGFEVGRFNLECDGEYVGRCVDGVHRLQADMPVGVFVVGEDSYNSYGYLGGVGVRPINLIISVV